MTEAVNVQALIAAGPLDENGRAQLINQLYGLRQQLGEVESEIEPLEAEKKRIRDEMSVITELLGGKVTLEGVGRFTNTAIGWSESYDKSQIKEVIDRLTFAGQDEIADAIKACLVRKPRAGGFRFDPEKPKKADDQEE